MKSSGTSSSNVDIFFLQILQEFHIKTIFYDCGHLVLIQISQHIVNMIYQD
jgi:hypothetical protein